MKSAKTCDLIADLETKSLVCSASCVAHFLILLEASLFSNMSRRGKDIGIDLVALEVVAELSCSHNHSIGHLLHF